MNVKKLLIVIFLLLLPTWALANYSQSVVRISSNLSLYDYKYPWKASKQQRVFGSGVIIKDQYILTAAHVVHNAKTIHVSKSAEQKQYSAKVEYISYQADLALLKIFDTRFFKGTTPLKLGDAQFKDKILVAGYPFGTKKLWTKKGLVRKIEYNPYALSHENLLSLQLNINLKEGNSGGPVLNKKNEIVGIAMQVSKGSQNIAYAIPSFIIRTFLKDAKDSTIDGFHSNANAYQYLQNPLLQSYYAINRPAMLLTDVDIEESQLQVNDIILEINGHEVPTKSSSNSAIVAFFSQFHTKTAAEQVSITLLRNKEKISLDYELYNSRKLIAQEFENRPRYYIFAGLVFTPITRNYLQAIGMKQYEINMLFYEQKRDATREEPVAWMQTKFAHPINKGYDSKVEIVDKINGIKVRSLKHFVSLIHASKQKYIIIDFVKKQRIILDKEDAIKSFVEIQKQYNLGNNSNL